MKRGHKEGTQNNNKESPLCYIDGHPPHTEVRVHPGGCSKEQSQEWNYFVLHTIAILNKMQFTGSTCQQRKCCSRILANAIITYQPVPKECVVKVVSACGRRELFARQLTPREGPKVTLRDTWVHTSSDVLHQPRETESKLQMWDYNPIPSESRSWPDEECVQSVDLRVNGIPNDEIYKNM